MPRIEDQVHEQVWAAANATLTLERAIDEARSFCYDAACATRAAAGLRTLQADISLLDPREFAPCRRVIMSPPCQAFSPAGDGLGRAALPVYIEAIERTMEGKPPSRDELDEACSDERGHLVLEPLRWALALEPEWLACEQVEPVLPLWEAIAFALRRVGYRTWAGVLSAERYGTPQTRKRAILMCSRVRQPGEPPASHARYVPSRVKAKQEESLFDAPEPERIVLAADRALKPWVSMAEALGWGMTARPYPVIAGGTGGGPDLEKVGGSEARATIYEEQAAGRWAGEWRGFGHLTKNGNHEDGEWIPTHARSSCQDNATVRSVDEPAPTITGAKSGGITEWVVDAGSTHSGASPDGGRARRTDEPAAAVTSRADQLERRDGPPTHYDSRQQTDGKTGKPNRKRSVDEPAPTIAGESRNDSWVHERPATTVAGDPRVFPPGHKLNDDDDVRAGRQAQHRSGAGSSDGESEPDGNGAVRVSIAEASVLQDFPADYPWQGTRTAIYRQIGDAVPGKLARAVLEELLRD